MLVPTISLLILGTQSRFASNFERKTQALCKRPLFFSLLFFGAKKRNYEKDPHFRLRALSFFPSDVRIEVILSQRGRDFPEEPFSIGMEDRTTVQTWRKDPRFPRELNQVRVTSTHEIKDEQLTRGRGERKSGSICVFLFDSLAQQTVVFIFT